MVSGSFFMCKTVCCVGIPQNLLIAACRFRIQGCNRSGYVSGSISEAVVGRIGNALPGTILLFRVLCERDKTEGGNLQKGCRLLRFAVVFFSMLLHRRYYPTLPSRLIWRSFCASTANSIGSLFTTSFTYPFTMSPMASSSPNPR